MRILAIETSCDETSIAVLETDKIGGFKLLSNIVSSQVKIHAPFGGVVPMLAKREHQRNLLPVLKKALAESKLLKISNSPFLPLRGISRRETISKQIPNFNSQNQKLKNLKLENLKTILSREPELLKKLLPFLKKYQKPDIDLIAVTNGPGLEPALWVGVNFAKALGYFWGLPVMPINHVEAHITANWLEPVSEISNSPFLPLRGISRRETISKQVPKSKSQKKYPNILISQFPAICLVVSGGHTQLVLMKNFGKYEILGETRDDAAGEAFDKLAKMLNLGYPGGPLVAEIASKFNAPHPPLKIREGASPLSQRGVGRDLEFTPSLDSREGWGEFKIKLPRPMLNSPDYDFSFSGLKTAALYFTKTLDKKTLKKLTPAICAEFQQAVVDVLVQKTIRAAKEYNVKMIMLSGGVASNDLLRDTLSLATNHLSLNFSVPPKNFCTDNAAMIALTAYLKTKKPKPQTTNWKQIKVDANLRLS